MVHPAEQTQNRPSKAIWGRFCVCSPKSGCDGVPCSSRTSWPGGRGSHRTSV